jgi:TonB family protein
MRQLDLISNPRADRRHPHRRRAFLASCVFHGLALCLLLGLTLLYRSYLPPPKSGSAPGAPSISLETMVIVSPPPQPPDPQPPMRTIQPPAPAPILAATTPPREPEAKPPPPEGTVPVLAAQPGKPAPAAPAKTQAAIHPAISHTAPAMAQSRPRPAAAAPASSYAPGLNVLPHPPYPTEARDLRETGIVIVNVQFDARGNVADAKVAQSSGVPILDSETRSFIREHWHSAAYAGQTISQPVQYSLENF